MGFVCHRPKNGSDDGGWNNMSGKSKDSSHDLGCCSMGDWFQLLFPSHIWFHFGEGRTFLTFQSMEEREREKGMERERISFHVVTDGVCQG